jgi:uncharacterized membrane protein YedE/YeeE
MHLAENIQLTNGVIGGLIIGLTSTAMYYLTGKVTGISGIVEDVVLAKPCKEEEDWCSWTHSYVAGIVSSGVFLARFYPQAFGFDPTSFHLHPEVLVTAGFLTGLGTRLGSGCTSGHGICGLPRRSPRSLTAVLTFMSTGAIAAHVSRLPYFKKLLEEVSGALADHKGNFLDGLYYAVPALLAYSVTAGYYSERGFLRLLFTKKDAQTPSESEKLLPKAPVSISRILLTHLVSFASAVTFGVGLGFSGMCDPSRVHRFLDMAGDEGFDPTLMGVMGGGVLLNLVTFHLMHHNDVTMPLAKRPMSGKEIKLGLVKQNIQIDWKLVLGKQIHTHTENYSV